ncbi:MAG: phosphotransferase [Clostridioides sp.]|jgi:aminoglycoside phosphotransferase (APT) family kinase protein|nr:phosphotransferase [Clostridioides sp.]
MKIDEIKKYIDDKSFKKAVGIDGESEVYVQLLGQGEYNVNYVFGVSGEEKYVLRLNTASQMHLENQIEYEYNALEILKNSSRTPMPIYLDDSREKLDYGVLVMEYLPGVALDYTKDLHIAAACLADIHSTEIPKEHILISPQDPLKAMLEECEDMSSVYLNSNSADETSKEIISRLLDKARLIVKKRSCDKCRAIIDSDTVDIDKFDSDDLYVDTLDRYAEDRDINKVEQREGLHIINTELNSGNFLINGEGQNNYIIDWEKPLIGEVEQDLGHFLAPTTTLWKTDIRLSKEDIDEFVRMYIKEVNGRFDIDGIYEKLNTYITFTCLRGITWSAMAWVEYQSPDKLIRNEDTYRKIKSYLEEDFLISIERDFF